MRESLGKLHQSVDKLSKLEVELASDSSKKNNSFQKHITSIASVVDRVDRDILNKSRQIESIYEQESENELSCNPGP